MRDATNCKMMMMVIIMKRIQICGIPIFLLGEKMLWKRHLCLFQCGKGKGGNNMEIICKGTENLVTILS